MSNISLFKNEKWSVRGGVDDAGEPWFVAKDVAVALGYKEPGNAIRSHCRGGAKYTPIADDLGRTQEVRIIGEPDVYRLIFGSKLETAQEFENWVVSDVLPSIRKTGSYTRGELPPSPAKEAPLSGAARELRLQFRMFRSVAKEVGLTGNQAILSANQATRATTGIDVIGLLGVTHLEPETNARDLTPGEIAARLSLSSAQEANRLMTRLGYQTALRDRKNRVQYEPTDKGRSIGAVYKDTGRKHSTGAPVKQLFWPVTIVDRLRKDMEQERLL